MANPKTIHTKLLMRSDLSSNWLSNPILDVGEIGYDDTLKKIKIGDGVKTWSQLQFVALEPKEYRIQYNSTNERIEFIFL